MGDVKDLKKKTVIQLEEQIRRQKALLKNIKFIDKLPDKGEKLKATVRSLENELKKRKFDAMELAPFPPNIDTSFEWSMGIGKRFPQIRQSSSQVKELDSDDESEEESNQDSSQEIGNKSTLRLLATSQISQNQSKIVKQEPEDKTKSELSKHLAKLELTKEDFVERVKFRPHCSTSSKKSPSRVQDSPKTKLSNAFETSGPTKFFECLFPLKTLENPPLKVLTLEESLKSEQDRERKHQESIENQTDKESRKLYAYDELLKQGKIPMTTFHIIANDEYTNALSDVRGDDDISVEDGGISEDSDENENE